MIEQECDVVNWVCLTITQVMFDNDQMYTYDSYLLALSAFWMVILTNTDFNSISDETYKFIEVWLDNRPPEFVRWSELIFEHLFETKYQAKRGEILEVIKDKIIRWQDVLREFLLEPEVKSNNSSPKLQDSQSTADSLGHDLEVHLKF